MWPSSGSVSSFRGVASVYFLSVGKFASKLKEENVDGRSESSECWGL